MRISTAQMYQSSMNNMAHTQSKLNTTYNQLGTGKNMLTPADDPVAAAQTLNIKTRIAVVQQQNTNADFASKNLSLTESVMSQMEDSLTRLNELAIQLGSGQWSDEQVKSSGVEAREILSFLQGLVNTQNESGEYIFAGSQASQKAYEGNTFQGDSIEREAQVADDVMIRMLTSGTRAFEGLDGLKMVDDNGDLVDWNDPAATFPPNATAGINGTGPLGNMLEVVQYFVNATGNGNPTGEVDQAAIRASINNIDQAFDQVSKTRAQIGSRMNTVDAVKSGNEDFALFAKTSLSELEDLDYAEAISRMYIQMNSLQASQQTFVRTSGMSLFNYIN